MMKAVTRTLYILDICAQARMPDRGVISETGETWRDTSRRLAALARSGGRMSGCVKVGGRSEVEALEAAARVAECCDVADANAFEHREEEVTERGVVWVFDVAAGLD